MAESQPLRFSRCGTLFRTQFVSLLLPLALAVGSSHGRPARRWSSLTGGIHRGSWSATGALVPHAVAGRGGQFSWIHLSDRLSLREASPK